LKGKSTAPDFIPARWNFYGNLLIFGMSRRSLWRNFHAVRFRAAEPLPVPRGELKIPVIFYLNHSNWYDGYVAQLISQQIYGLQGYLMMDIQQLRRYPFFTWGGAFSVDRANARSAIQSLDYLGEQLKQNPGKCFWIFPQGEIQPQDKRPLEFFPGLAWAIRKVGECYVYPVALRYEFFREQFPEVLVDVGPVRYFAPDEKINPKKLTQEMEDALASRLDNLHDLANNRKLDDFVTVLRGKTSTDTFVDSLVNRLKRFGYKGLMKDE
jgi:chlorobactene lauroyltransferase